MLSSYWEVNSSKLDAHIADPAEGGQCEKLLRAFRRRRPLIRTLNSARRRCSFCAGAHLFINARAESRSSPEISPEFRCAAARLSSSGRSPGRRFNSFYSFRSIFRSIFQSNFRSIFRSLFRNCLLKCHQVHKVHTYACSKWTFGPLFGPFFSPFFGLKKSYWIGPQTPHAACALRLLHRANSVFRGF